MGKRRISNAPKEYSKRAIEESARYVKDWRANKQHGSSKSRHDKFQPSRVKSMK